MNKYAIISASGGLDSTCLMLELLAQGKEVKAYSFDYGQKHDMELEKLKKNIKFLQDKELPVCHSIIDLKDCFSDNTSSLVKSTGIDIPHGNYDEDNMRSTVVPLRNVIFSSIIFSKAINWSKQTGEDVDITLGIHAGDHTVYPDTTDESRDACEYAFKISDWDSDKVHYVAPFVNIDKAGVLLRGLTAMHILGFTEEERDSVLENTHTCYDPNESGESCGLCGSCRERLEAFDLNGLKDPIKYQKKNP